MKENAEEKTKFRLSNLSTLVCVDGLQSFLFQAIETIEMAILRAEPHAIARNANSPPTNCFSIFNGK